MSGQDAGSGRKTLTGHTRFIGRQEELSALGNLLGEVRLVTLTGVGGVGKSRIAREAVDSLGGRFPDGAYVVELSGLRDPGLVVHAVAGALELTDHTTRPRVAGVVDESAQIVAAPARRVPSANTDRRSWRSRAGRRRRSPRDRA